MFIHLTLKEHPLGEIVHVLLKYKEKEIMNLRIGTGLPNIQKKDLENFTILVPSLLIQRKNLALFEMLDEKISILNEELANLQKQKKYLLCNMFI